MYLPSEVADQMLRTAVDAAERGGPDVIAVLDCLDAPIYVTDADGVITHFNAACIGFAGRTPARGKDRWCVTWKLYTDDGAFLPHDKCPMAVAILEGRAVRGVTAVAERPDGTRVMFMPLPTPLIGEDGKVAGAVNMFIDVTDIRQIDELRHQARRCRRLSRGVSDRTTTETLAAMAAEYEQAAAELDARCTAGRLIAARGA